MSPGPSDLVIDWSREACLSAYSHCINMNVNSVSGLPPDWQPQIIMAAVPEPGMALLLALGLIGVFLWGRRAAP